MLWTYARTVATVAIASFILVFSPAQAQNYESLIQPIGGTGDEFGFAVSSAGDFNADGYGDVIIGARKADAPLLPDAGRAVIFFGGPMMDEIPDLVLEGQIYRGNFGTVVEDLGDVNGDGFDDLAVGAPAAGTVYLYYGGPNADSEPDVVFSSDISDDNFGYSLAGPGDVNNDGYADLIIGARRSSRTLSYAGEAHLYLGGPDMSTTPSLSLAGEAETDNFGYAVAGIGDFDSDGIADFAVSAPGHGGPNGASSGRVYVYYGNVDPGAMAFTVLDGLDPYSRFGESLAPAGDLNNDGVDDLLCGVPRSGRNGSYSGAVYVFHGGVDPDAAYDVELLGENSSDYFGWDLSGNADLNLDGAVDLLVSAYRYGGEDGRIYIYYGGASFDDIPDDVLVGSSGDRLGQSVDGVRDVNGDGFDDIIAGAPLNDLGGTNAGRAFLSVGIDHLPPSVSILDPTQGQSLTTPNYTFRFTGADNVTPIADLAYSWRLDSNPWSSFTAVDSFALTSILEGPHSFEVLARDLGGNVSEQAAAVDFSVALIDLTVTDVSYASSVLTGDSLDIIWTVHNSGLGIADPWVDRITLSQEGSSSELELGQFRHYSPLDPIADTQIVRRVRFPLGAAEGPYQIRIATDYLDEVVEWNAEDNNDLTGPPIIAVTPRPDLFFTELLVEPTGSWPDPYSTRALVTNGGTKDLTQGFRYTLRITDQTTTVTFGPYWEYRDIAVGDTITLELRPQLPEVPEGDYDFHWEVDSQNDVDEGPSGESNNDAAEGPYPITSPPYPDLVVTGFALPDTSFTDRPLALSYTVANQGTGQTLTQTWRQSVYIRPAGSSSGGADLGYDDPFTVLAAGDSVVRELTPLLPNLSPGDYQIQILTDHSNAEQEYFREDNNTTFSSSFTLIEPPHPDLVVSSVSLPDTAYWDTDFDVSYVITNQGDVATDVTSWTDRIYLSTDDEVNGNDILLSSSSVELVLGPGESAPLSRSVRSTRRTEIDWYVIVRTDVADQVEEHSGDTTASNSRVAGPIPILLPAHPDLRVTEISIPLEGLSGQPIEISWTIQNFGTGSPSQPWQDRVYLATDPSGLPASALGTITVDRQLLPGEAYILTQSFTLPEKISGPRWIKVTTDLADVIEEYDFDTNNSSVTPQALTVRLSPYPDLIVTSVGSAPSVVAGGDLTVTWTVLNNGESSSNASVWYDWVYISRDPVELVEAIRVGSFANPIYLAPDEPYAQTQTVAIPDRIAGDYWVHVVADATHRVDEHTGEGNNRSAAENPVNVDYLAPFLVARNVSAPPSAWSGFPVNLSWTVRNEGDAAFAFTDWSDQVYLSTDTQLSEDDIPLLPLYRHTTALDPDQSDPGSISVLTPGGIEGFYHLLVRPNVNNTGGALGTVGSDSLDLRIAPPADLALFSADMIPSVVETGSPVTLQWTVINNGAGPTTSDGWRDAIYLSEDEFLDEVLDHPLLEVDIEEVLMPGDTYTRELTTNVPSGLVGQFYLIVTIDRLDAEYEEGEIDPNVVVVKTVEVTLSPPDLLPVSVTPLTSAFSGQDLIVQIEVTNQGIGTAAPANWIDRLWLSEDGIIDSQTDRLLTSRTQSTVVAPTETYAVPLNVAIPNGLEGPMNLILEVDATDRVDESTSEENNTLVVPLPVTLTPPPDLAITELLIVGDWWRGQTGLLAWTIQNRGVGPTTGPWWDRIYLSGDDQLDVNQDDLLLERLEEETLAADAWLEREVSIDIPERAALNSYIFFVTDHADDIYEHDDLTPNRSMVSVQILPSPTADLAVLAMTAPETIVAQRGTQVQWSVRNIGPGSTIGSTWSDVLYISADPVLGPGDQNLFQSTHTGGEGDNGYFHDQTIVIGSQHVGTRYLILKVDYADTVYEPDNETNNLEIMQIEITPEIQQWPNLTVSSLDVPSTVVISERGPIPVSWTVTNDGAYPTSGAPSTWVDRFFLSQDAFLSADDVTLHSATRVGTLPAGTQYESSANIFLPPGTQGSWYLILDTDATSRQPETDEADNSSAIPFQVTLTPVDLVVLDVESPDTVTSGQPFSIFYTVRNQGAGPMETSAWTDRFYLSRDQVLDSSDSEVGSHSHTMSLLADGEIQVATTAEPPLGLSGLYYLIVKTDVADAVYEALGETNNSALDPFATDLVLPLPADLLVTEVRPPEASTVGTTFTLDWTVENVGDNPLTGTWTDAVFLSADDAYSADDRLLGTIAVTQSLAKGSQYSAQLEIAKLELIDAGMSAETPGLLPGDYRLLVRTDTKNNVYETDEANNLGSSTAATAVAMTTISEGVPTDLTFPESGVLHLRLDGTLQEDLELLLTGLGGGSYEILVDYGRIPDRSSYRQRNEFTGGTRHLLTRSDGSDIYIALHALDAASWVGVRVESHILPFGVTSLWPDHGGSRGFITIELRGGGFEPDMTPRLERDGEILIASRVRVFDRTLWRVTFDLRDASLGLYDLVLGNESFETRHESTFLVEPSTNVGQELAVFMNGPLSRNGRVGDLISGDYIVSVLNVSNNDVEALSVGLISTNSSSVSIRPLGTRDSDLDPDLAYSPGPTQTFHINGRAYNEVLVYPGLSPGSAVDVPFRISGLGGGRNEFQAIAQARTQQSLQDHFERLVEEYRRQLPDHREDFAGLSDEEWSQLQDDSLWEQVLETIFQGREDLFSFYTSDGSGGGSWPQVSTARHDEVNHAESLLEILNWLGENGLAIIVETLGLHGTSLAHFSTGWGYFNFGSAFVRSTYCAVVEECYAPDELLLPFGLSLIATIGWCSALPGSPQCILSAGSAALYLFAILVDLFAAIDPNEKLGPLGLSGDGLITAEELLPYVVFFENLPTATAPAARVVIRDTLQADLDPRSFRLGEIAFADTTLQPPANRSFWDTRVELADDYELEIIASIDVRDRVATWTFQILDPSTGLPPIDPLAGFLAPNDSTGRGEGHVGFTVQLLDVVSVGTLVQNKAAIYFDANEPITTNTVENTVRASSPELTCTLIEPVVAEFPILEGSAMELRATVENLGEASASAFEVSFYLGETPDPGQLLGTMSVPEGLPPGTQRVLTIPVTTTGLVDAADFLVVVDEPDTIPESDESNNVRSIGLQFTPRAFAVDYTQGLNFIARPLQAPDMVSASDVAAALGANTLIRVDETGLFEAYVPDVHTSIGWVVSSEEGYLADLTNALRQTWSGASPERSIDVNAGLNAIAVPRADASLRTADALARALGASAITEYDRSSSIFRSHIPDFHEGEGFGIEGATGYLVVMPNAASLQVAGEGWHGVAGTDSTSNPPAVKTTQNKVFVFAGQTPPGIYNQATVLNGRTGATTVTRVDPSTGEYGAAFLDLKNEGIMEVGDLLTLTLVHLIDPDHEWSGSHTVTPSDLERGYAVMDVVTGVEDLPLPRVTSIHAAVPNPFNPRTTIRYEIAERSAVSIKIYDARGRLVRDLVKGIHEPGFYDAIWEGCDSNGSRVASGVYYYRFTAPGVTRSMKMILVK